MFKFIKKLMNTIKINGQNINVSNVSGKSISIINGKVIIDGVDVTPDSKNISIEIIGNVDNVEVGACNQIKVQGDVNKLKGGVSEVEITGSVTGDVTTSTGDVRIRGNVTGDVQTSTGDVEIDGTVGGSVKTSTGDIKHRKG